MSPESLNRIQKWFDGLNRIGVNPDGSTQRLGYTSTEDEMIEFLSDIARQEGWHCYVDGVGNTFFHNGEGKGEYTLIGSHVDSVVSGGKYDGIVGVLAGMLILKEIEDEKLNIPLKVGIFRMEESSVFGMATVGSSLVTKKINEEALKKLTNSEGTTLYEIMKDRGYDTNPPKITGIKQFLEIHIEQGRVLEEKGLSLGVVSCIAAPTRSWVTIKGRQDHSGATPMDFRKDALAAAAEVILAVEKAGCDELENASVATVGIIRNIPNAFNVVPGEVTMGVDIRGIEKGSIQRVVTEMESAVKEICGRRTLECNVDRISASDPVELDSNLRDRLSQAASRLGIDHMIMPSGAGHDAMKFTDICPVGMLFVPCREGISHNKEEYARLEDVVQGCAVFLEYLKNN